tara:strand:+ start:1456 stop:1653 length:198 start_codon:yes stop_codon:yes gene_type:complete
VYDYEKEKSLKYSMDDLKGMLAEEVRLQKSPMVNEVDKSLQWSRASNHRRSNSTYNTYTKFPRIK